MSKNALVKTDKDFAISDYGTMSFAVRGVPVSLVQPNPYLNYNPLGDNALFNIVDRDYGSRFRVSQSAGVHRKQIQLTIVMFTVSSNVNHGVHEASDALRGICERAVAVTNSRRGPVALEMAMCYVDENPHIREMLIQSYAFEASLLPILILFEDGVAKRPPLFRPLDVKFKNVPTVQNILSTIETIANAKIS